MFYFFFENIYKKKTFIKALIYMVHIRAFSIFMTIFLIFITL